MNQKAILAVHPPGGSCPVQSAVGRAESEKDDERLLQRLRAGEESAFAELIGCYAGSMLRLAGSFVSNSDAAQEVVQETWLAVLQGAERFEGRSRLKTWIFRILSNQAKTRGVRDKRIVPFSSLGDDSSEAFGAVVANRFTEGGRWQQPPELWPSDAPDRVLMAQQSLRRLEQSIAALPPSQRIVVTLRDVEGLSSAEVCSVLQIAETNQRVLLHRARSRLRQALEESLERK